MKNATISDMHGGQLTLSKLILGTVWFGSTLSEEASFELMDTYYEKGGRTIDTARVYSTWLPGGVDASERTVGNWLASRGLRDQITLITKGAHPPYDNMHCSRVSPENIRGDLEKSLHFLQTDRIDLYFMHRDNPEVPVSVIMDTLDEYVKDGTLGAIGASNWSLARIQEANAYARENGRTPFAASEIQWSRAYVTNRILADDTLCCMDDDPGQLDAYKASGIPVLAYSSQAAGLFQYGYQPDFSDIQEKHRKYYCEENVRRYQEMLKECEEKKITPSQAVIRFITEHQGIEGFALVGPSSKKQLLASLAAMDE